MDVRVGFDQRIDLDVAAPGDADKVSPRATVTAPAQALWAWAGVAPAASTSAKTTAAAAAPPIPAESFHHSTRS
jgi:hypothetical protein